MMARFIHRARDLGVRFINGTTIKSILEKEDHVVLKSSNLEIESEHLLICTNGFTNLLVKDETKGIFDETDAELKPARNQVLVTEEIRNLKLNSCYHYDKGYVYFRNIGNRLLIGGGRNIGGIAEETTDFGSTSQVRSYLMDILKSKIGLSEDIKIDFEWSGILGIGPLKSPILRKRSEHIIFAVRLGGMGVALGSRLGDQAAKLLLKDI
jgi:glycine/D-amino acid oxidase-like deaminating enzyme